MPGSSAESNRSLPVRNPFGDATVATQSNAPKQPNPGLRAAKPAHTSLVSRAPWAGLRLPTPSEALRRPGPQHRRDRASRFGSPGPLPGSMAPSSSSVSPPEPLALRGRSPRVSLQQPQWRTKGSSGQRREQKCLLQLEAVAAIQGLNQDTSGGEGGHPGHRSGSAFLSLATNTAAFSSSAAQGPGLCSRSSFRCTTISGGRRHNGPQHGGGESQVQRG